MQKSARDATAPAPATGGAGTPGEGAYAAELTTANQELHSEVVRRSRLEQEILLISEREREQIGRELRMTAFARSWRRARSATKIARAEKIGKKQPKIVRKRCSRRADGAPMWSLARDLARGFAPSPRLSTSGFVRALHDVAYRISQSPEDRGVVSFVPDACANPRRRDCSQSLSNRAQEAVNNAVPSTPDQSHITVSLRRAPVPALVLETSDDGAGVSEKSAGKGDGSANRLQHRAKRDWRPVDGGLAMPAVERRVKCTLPASSRPQRLTGRIGESSLEPGFPMREPLG